MYYILDGAIGGKAYAGNRDSCDGGFGGGGGSDICGGGGGGYIGGLVSNQDVANGDIAKYQKYGALSYNLCNQKIMVSGYNDGNGKIEIEYCSQ